MEIPEKKQKQYLLEAEEEIDKVDIRKLIGSGLLYR